MGKVAPPKPTIPAEPTRKLISSGGNKNGSSGVSGTSGSSGTNGTSGSSGTNGTSGSSGVSGTSGSSGVSGTSGSSGVNGTSGSSGINGTSGSSGVNAGANQYDSKSITIESPTSSENLIMFYAFTGITIMEVESVVYGSTPSVTIQLTYTANVSLSGTNILTTPTAITNTTTGQNLTSFSNANPPDNSWIKLLTTASSGTITLLHVSVRYTKQA